MEDFINNYKSVLIYMVFAFYTLLLKRIFSCDKGGSKAKKVF